MVLFKNIHHVRGPVAHVFGNHECDVTAYDLLIMKNSVADRLAGPLRILAVGQLVRLALEHGNRHLGDGINWDEVCVLFLPDDEEMVVVGRPDLESVLAEVLRVQ